METMPTPMSRATAPNPETSLADALAGIGQGDLRPRIIMPLSDLGRAGAAELADAWPTWDEATRITVVRRMAMLAEERIEFNFGRALRVALADESPVVRQLAVAALWEDDGTDLLPLFLELLRADPSPDVRAAAAGGLAPFAERCDAGALDGDAADELRATLSRALHDPRNPQIVRGRCLESLGAFSRDAAVWRLIEEAYDCDEPGVRASALRAMGRNMSPRWLEAIMAAFEHDDVELRYEAARASAALGDRRAVPGLAALASDRDVDVRNAAIAALGQVGGRAAVRVLEALARDAGEDEVDRIEEALEEASSSLDPLRAPV